MATLAFLCGSNVLGHGPFVDLRARRIETRHGTVEVHEGDELAVVLRHGRDGTIPPHRIDHRAHVLALAELGVERAIAFSSVGSLKRELAPGSWVVPHDFINLAPVLTLFDERAVFTTPALDRELRRRIADVLAALGLPFADRGVYFQSHGPRLETRAEIAWISTVADVVGMTFGHEATLCNEAGIAVAALCSVDNYAHGVAETSPAATEILAAKQRSIDALAEMAARLVRR